MDLYSACSIKQLCYDHYNKVLSKNGKPKSDLEWTVMSAIVMSSTRDEKETSYEVVSMGTGTKCIGKSFLCKEGLVVNDSHAEIIARRSFLCFLYNELEKALKNGKSIFKINKEGKFELQPHINFHFFSTSVPCGDACIISKSSIQNEVGFIENLGDVVASPNSKKRPKECCTEEFTKNKKFKLKNGQEMDNIFLAGKNKDADCDIHRTGAKCLNDEDKHLPGLNYHETKVLRTKPGRGDRTKSLSCSDKLCKWNILGVQGALLMHFLKEPIYLKSYIMACSVFDEEAFERAMYKRLGILPMLPGGYKLNEFKVFHLSDEFEHSRKFKENEYPSPTAIAWYHNDELEIKQSVLTKGRLLGLTKKDLSLKRCSFITKFSLFEKFSHLRDICHVKYPSFYTKFSSINYYTSKQSSQSYQGAWKLLRESCLNSWPNTYSNFFCFMLK